MVKSTSNKCEILIITHIDNNHDNWKNLYNFIIYNRWNSAYLNIRRVNDRHHHSLNIACLVNKLLEQIYAFFIETCQQNAAQISHTLFFDYLIKIFTQLFLFIFLNIIKFYRCFRLFLLQWLNVKLKD